MKEILNEWKKFLAEKVYGVQAFVYHGSRLPPEKFAEILINNDFKPGAGAGSLYGRGLYTVYDEDKQSNTFSGDYGDYVYKLKVSLHECISFDSDITKLVYRQDITPAEQAKILGKPKLAEKLKGIVQDAGGYTSNSAYIASKFLAGKVKGIVFTGRKDGKVAVFYDSSTIIPVAWKLYSEEAWNPFDKSMLKPAIARSATGDWEELKHYPELVILKKISKLPPKERVIEGDLYLRDLKADFEIPSDLKVTGILDLEASSILHLPPNISVGKEMHLSYTDIENLPANLKVGSDLVLSHTKIKTLPEDLEVKGNIIGFKGPRYEVPSHLRSKI
jgi:hypothetical protein